MTKESFFLGLHTKSTPQLQQLYNAFKEHAAQDVQDTGDRLRATSKAYNNLELELTKHTNTITPQETYLLSVKEKPPTTKKSPLDKPSWRTGLITYTPNPPIKDQPELTKSILNNTPHEIKALTEQLYHALHQEQ